MEAQQDIKMRILLAAKKLFAQQGYDGTSVRQICEEAGGNVALVSYHFGGKENVFFAILDTLFPGNQLDQYEEQLKDPVQGLKLIVEGVVRFKHDDPELAAIIHQEISLRTPRAERILSYTLPVWQKLQEVLDTGRKQGIYHFRSLDHALMMVMSMVLYPGCHPMMEVLFKEGEQKVEEFISDMVTFVLNGLGYQPDRQGT